MIDGTSMSRILPVIVLVLDRIQRNSMETKRIKNTDPAYGGALDYRL